MQRYFTPVLKLDACVQIVPSRFTALSSWSKARSLAVEGAGLVSVYDSLSPIVDVPVGGLVMEENMASSEGERPRRALSTYKAVFIAIGAAIVGLVLLWLTT